MKTVYLKITGKVQGVFFRASARDRAQSLGLTGWVKNTKDFVECMVSGPEKDVKAFIQWASRGPERAAVDTVETEDRPGQKFDHFSVIRGGD